MYLFIDLLVQYKGSQSKFTDSKWSVFYNRFVESDSVISVLIQRNRFANKLFDIFHR